MIINFVKDKDQRMSVGLFLTSLLFLSSFIQSLIIQHYFLRMYLVGARIRTALMNIIYKKVNRIKYNTINKQMKVINVNIFSFVVFFHKELTVIYIIKKNSNYWGDD
jgi:ATP-binding cassette, subfamily C (CFTR/MRP), member 1